MFQLFLFIISITFPLQNAIANTSFGDISTQNTPPAIHAIGDIMLSRSVGAMTKQHGTSYITNGYNPFHKAKKGDFVLMNLESPFSHHDRDTHERTFSFASNPRNIEVIKWLTDNKMGVVSLANNHMFNAGFEGFETTISALDDAHILHTGLSFWERKKFIEIIRENQTFCFWAYTYDGKKYIQPKTGKVWWIHSFDNAKNDVFEMQKAQCQHKIFMLHWGREYKVEPTEEQKKLAHFLVDNGATMIIGGHSHVLGKTEIYKNVPIFYSLGNAIFDQEWGKKRCEPNMDCIFDEKLKRSVVPTHIGTAVHLDFPYQQAKTSHWDIIIGKMQSRE